MLSGLLGVGGGTMMVPVFKIGYAMTAIASTATSLFTIILTSASGVITHLRNKTCFPRIGAAAGLGGACTSPFGVWLASISPEWAITLAVVVILAYSAFTMLSKAIKMGGKTPQTVSGENAIAHRVISTTDDARATSPVISTTHDARATSPAISNGGPQGRSGETSAATQETVNRDVIPALGLRECAIALAIGLVAGVASGYVGVGGGFLMVPMMMQLLHLPMKMTSGTSLIAVFILAIPGTITQAMMGNVQWIAGISVAIGSIPGAYLGSRLIPRVPERALRFLFAGMLFVAAILMAVNA